MGEVNQAVFVSEILSQIRSRGLDLDRLAHHKALQDDHALEKKEAIQYITKLLVDQMQRWGPTTQPDTGSQHKIAELQAKTAALEAAANNNQNQNQNSPAQDGPSAANPNPNRVQSPLEAAFQGQRPVAFDPAQLLVAPGSTNQWLENNLPESFSESKYKTWFRNLKFDIATRQTIERNIVAVDNWWQNQPEEAEATIHRVAVCSGVPPSKIKSGHNENLIKVLTVALTMTLCFCVCVCVFVCLCFCVFSACVCKFVFFCVCVSVFVVKTPPFAREAAEGGNGGWNPPGPHFTCI